MFTILDSRFTWQILRSKSYLHSPPRGMACAVGEMLPVAHASNGAGGHENELLER